MKKAAAVLNEFGVEYKAFVISAHRAGELLRSTVSQIEADGFEVIIAGAGLAAALPGVIAGMTTLPVIGVPLECVSDKSNRNRKRKERRLFGRSNSFNKISRVKGKAFGL